ncbi:hypothetical protein G647_06206 [Cladophialophora carrionii CBS 160.54]|uniref:Uncharacterized protein n=1 Tax=Cladophialophora carrionii CBS 160.54 TaxID=1279043 RepID=V9D766_9EURO|nr:uncharacterized protein G647_06206 [Cladophialophora carrionii CBS 160.54]ETI22133.1 hypothetical protein G647_06206 [Cladophialophora carrionii CBS 160.54]
MSRTPSSSTSLLHGSLDPTHVSSLYADWVHRPTPWPWVLASVSLSIILGFLGVQASYKSWEPKHQRGANIENGLRHPFPPDPRAYYPVHQRNPSDASVTSFSSYGESNRYGGLGRFALVTSIIGIGWSTIRAIALVVILIAITRGDTRHTYPGVISVVIMFTSVQTYLGSRAMPRILYLLIIVDLCVIYACIILALLSFVKHKETSYQEFTVQGGTCPCLLGFKTGRNMNSCAKFADNLPELVGCDRAYEPYGPNDTMTYPKSCLLSDENDTTDLDPNLMTYMVLAEIVVGGVGLLYGLIVLLFASRWIPDAIKHPSQLLHALTLMDAKTHRRDREYASLSLPEKVKTHKLPGRAIGMTVLAFIALLMFAAVTIVVHVLDETRPIRLFYRDSSGSLDVPVPGTATSVGGTSWSDCFVVDTPFSGDGDFREWWDFRQSRMLRAMALA